MINFYKNKNFTPKTIQTTNINFKSIFKKIPIVIKNSHLINTLLYKINKYPKSKKKKTYNFLNLTTKFILYSFFKNTKIII